MKFTTTLIRRTVVSLSAIAALTITGYAASQTAQTVQLVGSTTNNCVYSTMTVSPNGGVLVQCGGSTSSPGTFTVTGPTSLALNATTSGTTVKVTRTGGSSGASDVTVAVDPTSTSACSVTTALVSFADTVAGSQGVVVAAGGTAGSCVLTTSPTVGTAGAALTMQIVDPNADVVFAFSSQTSQAQVGQAGATAITATRTGGTNGSWSVPVVLSGDLTSSNLLPATSGTLSAAQFSFPVNSSTATINYTPPAIMPAGSTLVLTMQTPVATGTPVAGQAGTLTGTAALRANTLTLNGPSVGCPAYTGPPAQSLNSVGFINRIKGTSGYMVVYALPTSAAGFGQLGFFSNITTPAFGPAFTEVKISKCMGDFTDQADGCYQKSSAIGEQMFTQSWAPRYTGYYPNAATFASQHRCMVNTPGPWYINITMSFPAASCAGGLCGWDTVWKTLSAL